MRVAQQPLSAQVHPTAAGAGQSLLKNALAVLAGMAVTLCIQGYQFGQGNHSVYLIPALRYLDPHLLANDWWTTATFQYHGAFGWLTASLLRLGILPAAFLAGYLGLVLLLHLAWLKLARCLGASWQVYLLSVTLFYLSAGGYGLGMYTFLQDDSFLPSNIAAVAMLWGIYFQIISRPAMAGLCLGLAGLLHLNYAIVAVVLWAAWSVRRRPNAAWLAGTGAVLGLGAFSALPALKVVMAHVPKMPLAEFVDLYVRFRHPHHYDPSAWPWWLWVSFLWPMPLMAWAYAKRSNEPRAREAARLCLVFAGLVLVSLVFAGLWYVSESLIQMSLCRFSVYLKLFGCLGAAWWIVEKACSSGRRATVLAVVATPLVAAGGFLAMRFVPIPQDDAAYLALCHWAADPAHTQPDAIFLVPPQEQSFRWHARRAIVVNFKGVPQLSSEMAQWRDRLESILAVDDLRTFPRRFDHALHAIGLRYESLPPQHLESVARQYSARYIVVAHPLLGWEDRLIFSSGPYRLYDLQKAETGRRELGVAATNGAAAATGDAE